MEWLKRLSNFYRNDMRLSSKLLLSHLSLVLLSTVTIISFFGSSVYNLLIDTTINAKQQTAFSTATSVSGQLSSLAGNAESISSAYYRYITNRYVTNPEYSPAFNAHTLARAIRLAANHSETVTYQIYLNEGRSWILDEDILKPYVQSLDNVCGTYWYGIISSTGAEELYCPSLYLSPQEIEQYGDLAYVQVLPGTLRESVDGYIVAYFSQAPIIDALEQNLSVSRGASYIINSRDALVCDSDSELVGAYYINNEEVDRIVANGGNATYLGEDIIVCSYPVNRTDWQVVSILPRADALEESDQAVWRFLTICGVVFLLGAALSILLARTISGRIASVVNEMRQTPVSRPKKITSLPPSRDEVGQLVDSYNNMTDALNDLMDRQAEAAKALRLSEFKALQAQINPHFLYNCLDMINWLAMAGEQDKVCEAIQTLGKFYKLTLSKQDTFDTVQKETEHATLYVKLQNMRFQNRIRFVVDIDETIQSCIMPKLVFQPLVENAILHGIMERDDKTGEVVLAGWRDGDHIVFLIYDNGVGMTAAQLEKITGPEPSGTGSGTHIGVYNTNERLRLYYGPQYGLQYKSTPGQGTEVQIRIPFRSQSD